MEAGGAPGVSLRLDSRQNRVVLTSCLRCSFPYGNIRHMKAILVRRSRNAYRGGIVEIVIWQVPQPVPPSEHPFKYRLVYIVDGQRVVGYDNERGKGDHKHLGDRELPYAFRGVDQLMADFLADVQGA